MHSQFSLDLILAMAAYFALVAALVSAQNAAGDKATEAIGVFMNRTIVSKACFFIDFFSLDARNTNMNIGKKNFDSSGRIVARGKEQAHCLSKSSTDNALRIEQREREPV